MMKKYVLFILFLTMTTFVSAQIDKEANDGATVTSMDNFVLNESVVMYPNPVERYLTIHSNFPVTRVMVFNLLGDQVLDIRSSFLRIDMKDLNSGIYMIKIFSNQYSVTKKLVKK